MIRVSTNRMDLIRESHDSADGGICTNSNLSLKSNHYLVYNNKFVGFIRLHISTLFSYFACIFDNMPTVSIHMPTVRIHMPSVRICMPSVSVCMPLVSVCMPLVRVCIPLVRICMPSVRICMPSVRMNKLFIQVRNQYKQIYFRLMGCLLQLYQNNILIMYCLLYDIKAYLINLRHFTERLQLNNTNLDNWFDKRRILLSSYETIALIGK